MSKTPTIVRWIEPSEDGGHLVLDMSIDKAIAFQKEFVKERRPDFVYKNDDDALYDFVAIHWAELL
jgi:hypothetical protein